MTDLLEIDGSILEGGGQIVRIAISLSAILGTPVKVTKIRAGRSKPGLAAQHLKGIELVASMCKAKLSGASIGSTEIQFIPEKLSSGHYIADTKTAGSISLLLQAALPCALFAAGAGVTLELKGGTNVDMAPQIDYMTDVFAYALRRFKADFKLNILRRGYFPKGGGHVTVEVPPITKLHSVTLVDRGDVATIEGWSFVAGRLPVTIAREMADGAKAGLRRMYPINIDSYKEDRNIAPDNCNGIILVCESSTGCVLGSDALGKRGVPPMEVGIKAGEALHSVLGSGACVDPRAQDQIIIYMALAEGRSEVLTGEITLHTKTAIHIAELITKVKFNVEPKGSQNIISCTGLGIVNTAP